MKPGQSMAVLTAMIAMEAGHNYRATGRMAEIDEPPGYYEKRKPRHGEDRALDVFRMDKAQAKRDRKATRRKELK